MKLKRAFILWLSFCAHSYADVLPNGEAIASASPYATRAGIATLKKGGNAFDAAVTVSAVLAVTEPFHSGIGGGGFWLLYNQKKNKAHFIDGRERAPEKASSKMYLDKHGHVKTRASLDGPFSAAIPGEPAALAYINKHFGRLSLLEDLKPAIRLAKQGFPVDQRYVELVKERKLLARMNRYPNTRQIFLANGKPPKVGWRLVQKDLASTLEKLAREGRQGFYQGETAKELVKSVNEDGGIWTLNDLKNYRVIERQPLVGHYHGIKVITSPPPSAGGVSLLTMLNILSKHELAAMTFVKRAQLLIESMRLAYWDRVNYLGDPDFVNVPVSHLISKKHADNLQKYIIEAKATPSESLSKNLAQPSDKVSNTTHFSIIDKQGNAVSATLSVNYIFGSNFVAGKTGVLLNDEMDDFAAKPGKKNVFGLIGEVHNEIEPLKRPLSSMAPTMLMTPKRLGVLGTPGGSRIPTMILLGTLSYASGKHPIQWVSLPRFHHQFLPDVVEFENDAFTKKEIAALKAMGYHLKPLQNDYGSKTYHYGEMQAVEWNKTYNALYAASDPRHAGLAVVAH